ncbi:MAG TPA: D-2-hydroxyacid dehydrogenase [Dehalococcoidia bacterium]|nr:D-2-hydroxyacid dehydrogenase [Dehalococcoidia bacterium]
MDRLRILVTFPLEAELVREIEAVDPRVEVRVLAETERRALRGLYPSEAEAAAVRAGIEGAFRDADVIFGFWGAQLHEAFTGAGEIRDVAPNLKWIQLTSAGADRLLQSGFVGRGVIVTTASGLHATPIGEYVLAVMLMFAKGAPRFFRAQLRREWARFLPSELHGKTVGIVGMGNIGREVARLSKAFGCRVLGIRRSVSARTSDEHADEVLPPSELASLLRESDYVVLATPLTPETRAMIAEPQLRAMKPTAVLVNIARGPIVVEGDLVRALREGWIAGAALDVFEREPLPADSPLWDLENVILTPHISGGTEIYNRRAVGIFTDNIRRFLAGEPLRNVVDPERGY